MTDYLNNERVKAARDADAKYDLAMKKLEADAVALARKALTGDLSVHQISGHILGLCGDAGIAEERRVAAVSGPARTPEAVAWSLMDGSREVGTTRNQKEVLVWGTWQAVLDGLWTIEPLYRALPAARPQGTATPEAWLLLDANGMVLGVDTDKGEIVRKMEKQERYGEVYYFGKKVKPPFTIEGLFRASPPSPGVSREP